MKVVSVPVRPTSGPSPTLIRLMAVVGAIGLSWLFLSQAKDTVVLFAGLLGVGSLVVALIIWSQIMTRRTIGGAPRVMTLIEMIFALWSIGGVSLWFVMLSYAGVSLAGRAILVGVLAVIIVAIRVLWWARRGREGPR